MTDAPDIASEMIIFGRQPLETGITMEYARKGHGPHSFVLVHGYGDSWYSFYGMMQAFPDSCSVLAVSLRGFGESDKPETGYSIGQHAEDVIALLQALGTGPSVIVGHSMGTFIAREIALRAPGLAQKLVLVDTAATGATPPLVALARDLSELQDPLPRSFAHEFQAGTCVNPLGGGMTLDKIVDESMKAPAHVWKSALAGLLDYRPPAGPFPELAQLTLPVLLVWGAHDEIFLREDQDTLLAALPDARLSVYAAAGHAPNWEVPEELCSEIRNFCGL
ncbi:alpha/beta hydrolase (plasmid) [Thioclava sp. 'Guangxiensis']|uniref:alpha/beta fold hydrolase n=1 Tax=Thioclava sp. 'Guangxiensis' TaxID=3149044 RepID=UPI0032C49472